MGHQVEIQEEWGWGLRGVHLLLRGVHRHLRIHLRDLEVRRHHRHLRLQAEASEWHFLQRRLQGHQW